MGNQFDVAAGARLESTGRAPSNDEIVPRFSLDDINQAFDNNEFCFYLQPKCNAETGAIGGVGALESSGIWLGVSRRIHSSA